MLAYIVWLIMVTTPLILFLLGIREENLTLLYISYGIYIYFVFTGSLTYTKTIIDEVIKRHQGKNMLDNFAVPEWLNFLAMIISVFTLAFYQKEILAILLLISAIGTFRLYGIILPKVKRI